MDQPSQNEGDQQSPEPERGDSVAEEVKETAGKKEQESDIRYFRNLLRKLLKENPPVPDWKIKLIGEVGAQLAESANDVINSLRGFLLLGNSHTSRCGMYIIDAICKYLHSAAYLNEKQEKVDQDVTKQKKTLRARFMYKLDTVLLSLFQSLKKKDETKQIAEQSLRPLNKVENHELPPRTRMWMESLLNHWARHHYFAKATIDKITTDLNLVPVTTNHKKQLAVPEVGKKRVREVSQKEKSDQTRKKRKVFVPQRKYYSLFDLPDEVLLMIFEKMEISTLISVSTVCKGFHRLVMDRSIWRYLRLRRKQKNLFTDDLALRYARQWNSLIVLDLSDSHSVTDAAFKVFAEQCKVLQVVSLAGCIKLSSSECLSELIRGSRKTLKSLNISCLSNIVDQQVFEQLLLCEKLKELSCMNCTSITFEMFTGLFAQSKTLTYLDARCCRLLACLQDISENYILSRTIEELNLMHYTIESRAEKVNVVKSFNILLKLQYMFPTMHTLHLDVQPYLITFPPEDLKVISSDVWFLAYNYHSFKDQLIAYLDVRPDDAYQRGKYGESLLAFAIAQSQVPVITYLIKHFPDLYIAEKWEKLISRVFLIGNTLVRDTTSPDIIRVRKAHGGAVSMSLKDCATDFNFLLQFLSKKWNDLTPSLLEYCGATFDAFASNYSFFTAFVESANQQQRDYLKKLAKETFVSQLKDYLSENTKRNLIVALRSAELICF